MEEINVPDTNYQEEIKKCKTLEDVTGKNGLLQKLFKNVMQQLLEDKKIIGLYARGMTTRDIQSELEELYRIDVST